MNRGIELAVGVVMLVTTLVGSVVVVESRYAKAVDVKSEINELYAKTLKNKIMELQLKPPGQFTTSDKAMLEHLQQELREVTP